MKYLFFLFLVGTAAAQEDGFTIEYQKFDDYTTFTSKKMPLYRSGNGYGDHEVKAEVYTICSGQVPKCDSYRFRIFMSSSSENWEFLDTNRFVLLLDDERIEWGEQEHDGDVFDDGSVIEYMFFTLTRQQFAQLAYSGRVEGRVGTTEFVWRDRDTIKDLARYFAIYPKELSLSSNR